MANPNGGEESDDSALLGPSNVNEEAKSGSKRKLESMLNWVNEIAKDPGHPVVGSLPACSKWKASAHGDEPWKQVLSARETLLKENVDLNTKQLKFQKSQKMHPSIYNDNLGSRYNLRERKKLPLPSEAKSSTGISYIDLADELGRKQNGKGPLFQAEIPEWTDEAYESDSKWLGFRVWQPENTDQGQLPIGKGRQDSCGCQAPGSTECIKYHIAEESGKMELELGPAFDDWKFTEMGEQVALSWTVNEEIEFETIAKSRGVNRWDKLRAAFPTKSMGNLVSYYFNVFLLRHQNRSPATVNRESALRRPGSISSPSKSHSNTSR